MKRLGVLFAPAFLGLMMAGCSDSSLPEAAPSDVSKGPMTESHEAYMKKHGAQMQGLMKGKPKNIPSSPGPK